MKTEQEILIAALKRIEKKGIISELEEDTDGFGVSYYAPDRLGYYPTFRFNDKGEIIHAGVTI